MQRELQVQPEFAILRLLAELRMELDHPHLCVGVLSVEAQLDQRLPGRQSVAEGRHRLHLESLVGLPRNDDGLLQRVDDELLL